VNVRRFTALVAAAGVLTLAACGDPDNPPAAQAPVQQRTVNDVTSRMPAGWPATEAMRETAAFPAHGSPWYPTPAPEQVFPAHGSPWYPTPAPDSTVPVDPCLNRPIRTPQPC
jgi:hypothetical protein